MEESKCILLKEGSQSKKATVYFQLYEILQKDKIMKKLKRSVISKSESGRDMNRLSAENF